MIDSIHADRLFLGTVIRWRFTQGFTDGTDPTPEFTADRQRIVPVFQARVSIHESLSCLVSAPDPQQHGLPGQMLGFAIGDVLKIDTRRC